MYDSAYFYSNKYADVFSGVSKLGKGITYTDLGDFGNASITLKEAVAIFKEEKDSVKWLDTKNSIAILYGKNGFIKESKKERDEMIVIADKMKSYTNLPVLYYNNAATSNKLGLQKERIKNFRLSLIANETSSNKDFLEPLLKLGLAAAYAENDSMQLSNKLLKEVEAKQDVQKNAFLKSFYLESVMRIAFEKKQYQKAIQLGEEYLAMKYQSKDYIEIQKTEKFLYKIYKILGNKEKALSSYENYSKIKDSVSNVQNISALSYYQTLYETEKRDLTIKKQEDDILILDTKNKIKNQWLLFGGLGLLTVFGFVMMIRSRNFLKNKQKQQEIFTQNLINSQEKERSRVAKELHDSIGQRLLILKKTVSQKEKLDNQELKMITDTIDEVRTISHNLHSFQFEKIGLGASLENMLDEFQKSLN